VAEPTEGRDIVEPRLTAGRMLTGILIALGIVAVLIVFVGRAAGVGDVRATLRDAKWSWLAICAAGQVASFAGYAGVFRRAVAFEDGPELPVGLSVRVVLSGFAVSQLVAAGGAGGLAVNYWALRRLGLDRRDAFVRLLGFNTVVYLAFALIAWSAAVVTLVTSGAPLGATLPWIVVIPVLTALAVWFTETARVERWAAPSGGRLRRALSTGVAAAWWARRATAAPAGRPLLAWAALYWIGDIASLWGALHSFGAGPHLAALALVYAMGYAAAAIPIPFVATGGMDAALTFSLQMIGVPLETALVAVVAHRVFAFWAPLLPGIFLALTLRRTGSALDRAAVGGGPGLVTEGS